MGKKWKMATVAGLRCMCVRFAFSRSAVDVWLDLVCVRRFGMAVCVRVEVKVDGLKVKA